MNVRWPWYGKEFHGVPVRRLYRVARRCSWTHKNLSRYVVDKGDLGVDELAQIFASSQVAKVVGGKTRSISAVAIDKIDGIVEAFDTMYFQDWHVRLDL